MSVTERPTAYRTQLAGQEYPPESSFVVDDDPGMLMSVKRLLRSNGYDSLLFSSAKAFKNQVDFEDACCVVLDINLEDGSGIELRHRLNDVGISVPVIYVTGNDSPAIRKCAELWVHCVSNQAIFSSGADRAAQESICRAFIGFLAVRSMCSVRAGDDGSPAAANS